MLEILQNGAVDETLRGGGALEAGGDGLNSSSGQTVWFPHPSSLPPSQACAKGLAG